MTLSIIIPAYNAGDYINELFARLEPQINEEVEVIVIDDGSDEPVKAPKWATLIRQDNSGASSARNKGLDIAKGDYIAFIDADDLVNTLYVEKILSKIEEEDPDYIYLSWKTLSGGWQCNVKLDKTTDEFPSFNLCVWNRIYKRSLIGQTRFNEKKLIAEDAEFIRKVQTKGRKAFISDYMYYYRSAAEDSLTKRFANGELNTERIVYYYPRVTEDMAFLVDDFKAADKKAEVILMTDSNAIPELEKYAMVIKPTIIKGTELRGHETSMFKKIELPIRCQVAIYTAVTQKIGGIETWIYNFCQHMHKHYDIIVVYSTIDNAQKDRLEKYVRVAPTKDKKFDCDVVIVSRISDSVPASIKYKKRVQMVHACKMVKTWTVPEADVIVPVSNAVKKSFADEIGSNVKVIKNMTSLDAAEDMLILVSATRLATFEKGKNRMNAFADLLKKNGIKFVWFIFSDIKIPNAAPEMIFLSPTLDIGPYIAKADYLVQLSDAEGFCYSIVEALSLGTAVITTPIEVLKEIGYQDGVNGYTVPFEIEKCENISKIKDIPKFDYEYDNESIVKKWKSIIGKRTVENHYTPPEIVNIRAKSSYYDKALERIIRPGEVVKVPSNRAELIIAKGYAEMEGTNDRYSDKSN